LVLHAACPRGFTPDTPVLIVHHGVGRNGADYRDYWMKLVDDAGLLAIAIEFSEANFPTHRWYHFGNLHDADDRPNPPAEWTYGIDARLFDALRTQGVTARETYGVFGHSAGGQFVHRMLSFGFRDRVAVAVSANAGTYAMPDLATPWPFGLGETDLDATALSALVAFPLIIMAGTEDTKTTGRFFPKGPRSMQQGPTRYARAHFYVGAGRTAARALGIDCAWTVIDVPGVGHDGERMSIAAAPVIAAAFRAGAPG
jgi:poly(3-hydroxybutyrate) depolymerase